MNAERCGYALIDLDGEQYPCDRPAPHWRWYQDTGEHEDMLDAACDWHANEGGRHIHDLEAENDRLHDGIAALADDLQQQYADDGYPEDSPLGDIAGRVCALLDGAPQ